MSSNRLFSFIMFTFKVAIFFACITVNVFANSTQTPATLSNQVQQLLQENSEMLNTDEVMTLSNEILTNRQHYSNDILAKAFLLSANVSSNQGDINQVFKFAQSGLGVNSRDKVVNLSLLLKLAEVYMAKKEYEQLLSLTQSALNNSEFSVNIKYKLLLLSYRSVAFAVLGKHQQALGDLQQVELGISKSDITDHIKLLTILALSYHHLSDYQTSLTMQLKILKLRFEMGQKESLDQTYLYLGYAYFYLLKFDDAYIAFSESKKYAQNKGAPIRTAYANKGLGIVLLSQREYKQSIAPLQQATDIFQQNHMHTQATESMVGLVKAKLAINEIVEGYDLLKQIVKLLDGQDIALEFSGFYRMVAEMYLANHDYQNAYVWQEKHSQILINKLDNRKKAAGLIHSLSHLTLANKASVGPIEKSRELAVKLASNSELSSSFSVKFQRQRMLIVSFAIIVGLLLIALLTIILKLRAKRIRSVYEELEQPRHVLMGPSQTKLDYQVAFKKARKFQYPLNVGYLVVENWQEMTFRFNQKRINEVAKGIASLINAQLTEFDMAGLLTEGEYLLVFEHQSPEEVNEKIEKLVQALNSLTFANLGGFSIMIKYSLSMPDFKDIDPYLFLARIAESVNIAEVNQSKVS